jgi:hypothetical protein
MKISPDELGLLKNKNENNENLTKEEIVNIFDTFIFIWQILKKEETENIYLRKSLNLILDQTGEN